MKKGIKRITFWVVILAALCSVVTNKTCPGDPWNLHENAVSFLLV